MRSDDAFGRVRRMSGASERSDFEPKSVDEKAPDGRKTALGFAVRFTVIALVLFALYGFPYAKYGISQGWLDVYLGSYAKLVGFVLGVSEEGLSVQGNHIFGKASLQIVKSCDAMEINILLSAAILAFPGPPIRKALALLGALLAVAILNVARIVSLYYVLLGRKGAFEFLHLELWPLVMVVGATVFFVVTTKLMRTVPEPNRP